MRQAVLTYRKYRFFTQSELKNKNKRFGVSVSTINHCAPDVWLRHHPTKKEIESIAFNHLDDDPTWSGRVVNGIGETVEKFTARRSKCKKYNIYECQVRKSSGLLYFWETDLVVMRRDITRPFRRFRNGAPENRIIT